MLCTALVNLKKIILITLGILLMYTVEKVETDYYKLHKCENSMKKTLANILQRSDEKDSVFVTPFHETIAIFKNDSEAYQRIMWGCFSIFRFEKCLSILNDSHLKNLKLASIKHWKEICVYAREKKEDFHEFLNCERRHIFKTKSHCGVPSIEHNQTTLELFCENLYEYNRCYRSIDKRCAESALEISYILDKAVIESYSNIVKLATYVIKIPNTCNWIMKPNIKEISKNKYKESRESKKQGKKVYNSSHHKSTTNSSHLLNNDNNKSAISNMSYINFVSKYDNRHHHRAKNHKSLNITSTLKSNISNDEDKFEHASVFQTNDTTNNNDKIVTDTSENNNIISRKNDFQVENVKILTVINETHNDLYYQNFDWNLNSSDTITKLENTFKKNLTSSIFGLLKNKSNFMYRSYQNILLIILFILFVFN